MGMGTFIELTASDGHRLAAYRAEPPGAAGKARGAIVVIQEIFGVNSHIRSVADGYAAAGYVAIAPAMFDRLQRGYETGYSPDEIQAGIAMMQRLDWNQTFLDVGAAVAEAQKAGRVGMVGYCWGGTVAWRAASHTAGLSASVPYYGGGMPNFMDEKPKIPVMCHFGEQDKSPTPAQARELLGKHPEVQGHFYPAGHGFNCDQRGSYHAESAKLARERSLEFFGKHVG